MASGSGALGGDGGDGVVIVRFVNEPDPPTAVAGEATAPNEVTVSWTAPAYVGSGSITGYQVLISADDTSSFGTVGASGNCDDSNVVQTSCTVGGLDTGRTYYFAVKTRTLDGSTAYVSDASPASNGVAPFGSLAKFAVTGVDDSPIGSQTAGLAFSVRITAQDDSNQTVLSFDDTVTLTSSSVTSAGGGDVGPLVGGVLDDSITLTTAGSQTIAAANGSIDDSSTAFTVLAAAPAAVVLMTDPSSTGQAGVALSTQPVVQIEDTYGNLVTWDDTTIVTASSGSAKLSNDGTTVSGGVATFGGLSIDDSVGMYVLTFTGSYSSAVMAQDDSATVTIAPGTVAIVELSIDDSSALTVGYTRTLTARLYDGYGNLATNDDTSVVNYTQSGAGSVTFSAASGTVTGGDDTVTITGSTAGSVSLVATVNGPGPVIDDTVTISVLAGAPAALAVTRAASSPADAGSAFATQPQVSVKDANGNVVLTDNSTVVTATVSAGGSIIGDDTAVANSGVATFTDLGISGPQGTYTLTFTSGALTDDSQTLTVQVGAAAVLDDSTPAGDATYGLAFGIQPVITIDDSASNVVTSSTATVTATITDDTGTTLQQVQVTAVGGVADFATATPTLLGDDDSVVAGTHTVTYAAPDLGPVSQSITVGPATPSAWAWADDTLAFGDDTYLIPPVVNGVYGATNLAGTWAYASDDSSVVGVDPGTGIVTAISVGSATITGTFTPSSANYTTTTATMIMTVTKANQSMLSIVSDDTLVYGSSMSVVVAGGTGTGALSVVVSSGSAGCTLTGLVLTASSTGTCLLTANRAGDDDYNAAVQVSQTVTVIKADQVVSFTSSPPMVPRPLGTYAVAASSTSGLSVVLSITTGSPAVCQLSAGTVTFNASGTCVVTAAQAGNSNFNAAVSVTQTIVVGKLNQSITFTSPGNQDFGDPAFALTATASSGLPVVFSRDETLTTNTACSVDDTGVVTILAVGDCAITVNQAGNSVYAAASAVTRVFQVVTVTPSAPYITGVNVQNGGATLTFNIPGFSGGAPVAGYQVNAYPDDGGPPVTFSGCSTASPLVCTIPGLTNGVGYRFTVQAINSAGRGAESPLVPAANQPAITSAVRAAAVGALTARKGDTTLTASWTPLTLAQLGGGSFTRYDLRIAVSADDSEVATATLNLQSDDSHVFTGLTNGTAYTITVVAYTSVNATQLTGNTAQVSEIPARAPDRVTGSYQATSGTTGIVSWRPPVSDGGSPVLEYRIRLLSGGSTVFDDTTGANTYFINVMGLTRGTSYAVAMTVTNAVGSSDDTHNTTQPDVPAPPVITGAAPATVDDSVGFEVTWTAPANNGAPITGYQVTATRLAGRSTLLVAPRSAATYTCTSATTSCIVFAPGSVRDYSFVVNADNLAGVGPDSAPFVVPEPTPPGPGPVPPTPTPPSPQPLPGPVPPGTTIVEVDGRPDPGTSAGPNPDGTGLDVSGEGFTLRIQAKGLGGVPVPLEDGKALLAYTGERIEVSGSGFLPAAYTATFVLDPAPARQGRALGAPVRLGNVLVSGSGTFSGSWVLPRSVSPGEYVLQVIGTLSTGATITVDTGLIVRKADRRSIQISGERGRNANSGRVYVWGRTWDLNGQLVRARVKLQGQTTYAVGASRPVVDGKFDWSRKTRKKTYVYFQADGIRSQRIIIPSAKG